MHAHAALLRWLISCVSKIYLDLEFQTTINVVITMYDGEDQSTHISRIARAPKLQQLKIWTHLDLLNIPQSGKKMSKRFGGIIDRGCKYKKKLFVAFNRVTRRY